MTDSDRAKERRRARKRRQVKRKNAFLIVRFFALAILVLIVGIGVVGSILRPDVLHLPVNKHVQSYEPVIEEYAEKYGIKKYVDLVEAVMMQESHGKGTDPMQSSEGNYNKKYPSDPGGITDPEYSIDCGVHQLAEVLEAAGCKSTHDSQGIKLALQGYNYGTGYIHWALENYGGYSEENAVEFSEMMAKEYGLPAYGDKEYPRHVLRYYNINLN